MSWATYDDKCEGCLPAIKNMTTGEVVTAGDGTRAGKAMLAVWERTTLGERRAFHAVMCQNSRQPVYLAVVERVCVRLAEAIPK